MHWDCGTSRPVSVLQFLEGLKVTEMRCSVLTLTSLAVASCHVVWTTPSNCGRWTVQSWNRPSKTPLSTKDPQKSEPDIILCINVTTIFVQIKWVYCKRYLFMVHNFLCFKIHMSGSSFRPHWVYMYITFSFIFPGVFPQFLCISLPSQLETFIVTMWTVCPGLGSWHCPSHVRTV